MPLQLIAIAALDRKRGIGIGGKLPWRVPADLKRFSALTRGHTVVMGRKTWDSLGEKYRPLPERTNVVISRSVTTLAGAEVFSSPEAFLDSVRQGALVLPSERVWVIGGGEIYRQMLSMCELLELTCVEGDYQVDAYFPEFEHSFEKLSEERHEGFSFERWGRRR